MSSHGHGLLDFGLVDAEVTSHLAPSRFAAAATAQFIDGSTHLMLHLLDSADGTDDPGVVTEVPLDLTMDRRRGERGETVVRMRVEPLCCTQHGHPRDLLQVFDCDAPAAVPAGDGVRHRQIDLGRPSDERLSFAVIGVTQSSDHVLGQFVLAASVALWVTNIEPRAVFNVVATLSRAPGHYGTGGSRRTYRNLPMSDGRRRDSRRRLASRNMSGVRLDEVERTT